MTDPISDFITHIRNASAVGKESVVISYSKIKEEIANVLEKQGYITSVAKKGKKINKSLEIGLAYDEYGARIKGLERISKLSKRIYKGVHDLKPEKQGHGMVILTTPKGIMTDFQARKAQVGGELLFKVW